MNAMRDALLWLALLFAIGFMLVGLASFTVLPMMANYRECATIFLCRNQN